VLVGSASHRPEVLDPDPFRLVAKLNEQVGRSADERGRAADEDPWTSCGGRPNGRQHVSVEAPGEPPPRGGWIARERVMYCESVACRQPHELAAIEDFGGRACGDEQARVDRARLGRAMAQHRHQRHEAGAVRDKQQRSAIVDAPGERAADGTAQLQLVCDAKRPRQVRRNLPGIDPLTVNVTFALSGADAIAYERSAW
jgi:hypothetical protein